MDWFLYNRVLRHEIVRWDSYSLITTEKFKIGICGFVD